MNIERLIALVYSRQLLWDQTNSQHHNRYALDRNWDIVAKELNTTRDVVRGKWKSLRNCRKELKKIPKSRSGDARGNVEDSKSQWPYFDALMFLRDQFTPRSMSGNIDQVASPQDLSADDQEDDVATQIEGVEEDTLTESILSPSSSHHDDSRASTTPSSVTTSSSHLNKRKNKQNDMEHALVNIETKKLEFMEKMQSKIEDDDVSFFESILPWVKQMHPQNKLLFRMKVQQLIYEFNYGGSTRQDQTSNPPGGSGSQHQLNNPLGCNTSQYQPSNTRTDITDQYQLPQLHDLGSTSGAGSFLTRFQP